MSLSLQRVPARQGVLWTREAFALFARRPLALSVLLMAYLLISLALMVLPLVGPLLVLAGLPLLCLAYLGATRDAQAGLPVSPLHLFAPLRAPHTHSRGALILTCGLYAVLSALLLSLAEVVDGGSFGKLQQLMMQERTDAVRGQIDALLEGPDLAAGLWLRFGGMALLSIPFWFGPVLVSWHGQGVAQALFSSTLALWRNKGAYLAYVLSFAAVVMVFSIVTGVLSALVGQPALAVASAIPAGLLFSTVFYVSLYFGYRDTFAVAHTPASPDSPGSPDSIEAPEPPSA
jgi:hypothetical protein